MNEHIEAVQAQVRERIAQLVELNQELEALKGGKPVPAWQTPQPQAAKTVKTNNSKPKRHYPGGKKTMTMGLGKRMEEALKKIEATKFDKADLCEALRDPNVTEAQCEKWLWYKAHRSASKTLQALGKGWYARRERQVEGKRSTGASAKAPTLTLVQLQEKLENAIKQRDHARANGREQMEEIFQKEIDALERQLEGRQITDPHAR